MYKSPCKDCKKRVLGCHDTCPDYQNYKQNNDTIRKNRRIEHMKYTKRGGTERLSKQMQVAKRRNSSY